MELNCSACGARFRSMAGEARHRHNFPAMCRRNKRFAAWSAERNREAVIDRILGFAEGTLFIVVTTDPGHVVYERTPEDGMECVVNLDGVDPRVKDAGLGAMSVRGNVPSHWWRVDVPDPALVTAYHMLRAHGLPERACALFVEPKRQVT